MKAVIIYPEDPTQQEHEIDVPPAEIEHPERYEPESLIPATLLVPCHCQACPKIHTAVYQRKGFKLRDDAPIPVYLFQGVVP